MKKWIALCMVVAFLLTAVACTQQPNTSGTTNNTGEEKDANAGETNEIAVMIAGEPTTLDPIYSGSMYEDNIFDLVFDRLVRENESYEAEPALATSWEMVDEYTWRFYLDENAKFQDGEPVTAEDVVYTFERTADPAVGCTGNYAYAYPSLFLESCTALDDYTVEFKTEQPVVLFVDWMNEFYIFPKHIYESNDFEYLSQHPVGSGPYKLESWKIGEYIILNRDPSYWSDSHSGYIDKITWRFTTEASTRASELITGNVDLVDKMNFSFQEQIEDSGKIFEAIQSGTRQYIGITQYNNPALQVKEVRQALNYAIDFDTMAETLLNGYGVGERMASFAPPEIADDRVEAYPYDPDKAVELLEQAGYTDTNEDGFVEDAQGQTVALTLQTPAGHYVQDKEIAQVIASYIEAIGIQCSVELVEWGAYCDAMDAKELTGDLFLIGSGPSFTVSGDATDLYYASSANYGNWIDDDYTRIYEALGKTFDEDEQEDLAYELEKLAHDEAPWIFLYFPPLFYGMSERLDWQPLSNGRIFLRDAKVVGYDYTEQE